LGWTGRTAEGVIGGNPRFKDPMIDECHGYTVYGHLTPSMKWYFGITKKPPERRWGLNGQRYKSSPRFYAAIKKYGWDNIYHHIVGTGYTKEEACHLERVLIAEYRTLGDGGYNCTSGGDGLHDHKFTDEQIERMRQSHLGQQSPASKPVWCIETGQMFESASEASRAIGLNALAVSKAARGDRKTAGGLHWSYIGEVPQNLDSRPHNRKVLQVETGIVFESFSDAGKEFDVSPQAIRYATQNPGRASCGFHWRVTDG